MRSRHWHFEASKFDDLLLVRMTTSKVEEDRPRRTPAAPSPCLGGAEVLVLLSRASPARRANLVRYEQDSAVLKAKV